MSSLPVQLPDWNVLQQFGLRCSGSPERRCAQCSDHRPHCSFFILQLSPELPPTSLLHFLLPDASLHPSNTPAWIDYKTRYYEGGAKPSIPVSDQVVARGIAGKKIFRFEKQKKKKNSSGLKGVSITSIKRRRLLEAQIKSDATLHATWSLYVAVFDRFNFCRAERNLFYCLWRHLNEKSNPRPGARMREPRHYCAYSNELKRDVNRKSGEQLISDR